MIEEREKELRKLAEQFERCDYVWDARDIGGTRFSFKDSLIEALDAVRALREENAMAGATISDLRRKLRPSGRLPDDD